MNFKDYELSVLVNGRPIREYGHNGETYVAAHHKAEYSLRFRNNSSVDSLVIISIDGLSIVDGAPATENSRGYIIPSFGSYEIKGWRTSLNEIAKFCFNKKGKSYAQQMGNAKNCGVIGCRIYPQKIEPSLFKCGDKWHPSIWIPPYSLEPYYGNPEFYKIYGGTSASCTDDVFTASCNYVNASNAKFDMGTEFGSEINDNVSEKSFERGEASCEFVIYYISIDQLRKMGIEIEKKVFVEQKKLRPFADFCRRPVKNV